MFIANSVSIRSPTHTLHKYTEHFIAQETMDNYDEKLIAIGARCKQLTDTPLTPAAERREDEVDRAAKGDDVPAAGLAL